MIQYGRPSATYGGLASITAVDASNSFEELRWKFVSTGTLDEPPPDPYTATIRDEDECTDALSNGIEIMDVELADAVPIHIIRLIAEFVHYRKFHSTYDTV